MGCGDRARRHSQAIEHFESWSHGHFQGRRAFHSFSPLGRRWDEGAPAARFGIIVTPSPHPLPTRNRVYPISPPIVRKSSKLDLRWRGSETPCSPSVRKCDNVKMKARPVPAIMRLYEDVLSNDGALRLALPALPRMIFIVHGSAMIEGRALSDGEAWHGEGAVTLRPGSGGVTCWRFELAPADAADGSAAAGAVISRQKLKASVETLPAGDLLLRATAWRFRPAAAPICIGIRAPAFAACSRAAFGSTRMLGQGLGPRPATARAVPGMKPDRIRFLPKRRATARPGSSA
jgi:hypothetical protein